jgi:hypothetical protein
MKSTIQHLPLWIGEVITDGDVEVRRCHSDTLMLIHYHVTTRVLKNTHRVNIHDHTHLQNPLIVVYCGALPDTLMWL